VLVSPPDANFGPSSRVRQAPAGWAPASPGLLLGFFSPARVFFRPFNRSFSFCPASGVSLAFFLGPFDLGAVRLPSCSPSAPLRSRPAWPRILLRAFGPDCAAGVLHILAWSGLPVGFSCAFAGFVEPLSLIYPLVEDIFPSFVVLFALVSRGRLRLSPLSFVQPPCCSFFVIALARLHFSFLLFPLLAACGSLPRCINSVGFALPWRCSSSCFSPYLLLGGSPTRLCTLVASLLCVCRSTLAFLSVSSSSFPPSFFWAICCFSLWQFFASAGWSA